MLNKRYFCFLLSLFLFPYFLYGAAGSQVDTIIESARQDLKERIFNSVEEVSEFFLNSSVSRSTTLSKALQGEVLNKVKKILSTILLEQKYATEPVAVNALSCKKQEVVDEFKRASGAENKLIILKASLELLNDRFLKELLVDYGAAFAGPIRRALVICDTTGRTLLHDFFVKRDRYSVVSCNSEYFKIGTYSQFGANCDELEVVQDGFCRALQVLLEVEPLQVNIPIRGNRAAVGFGKTPLHLAMMIKNSRFRKSVIDLLLSYGANLDLKNDECPQSPREFAQIKNLEDLFIEYDKKKEAQKLQDTQKHKVAEEKRRQERRLMWGQFSEKLQKEARRKNLDDMKQRKIAHARDRWQFGEELLSMHRVGFQEREKIERLEKQVIIQHQHKQLLDRLKLQQREDQERIELEQELEAQGKFFQAGQKSRDVEIDQLRQRALELQAMSPSKLSSYEAAGSEHSSTRSSRGSNDLFDGVVGTSLALTPRGTSTVYYTIGADSMALEPQSVKLEPGVLSVLSQLDERNQWISPQIFTQAIPCDARVENMRASTLAHQKRILDQLKANNFHLLDHAMTTDFIRKVIQYGSVYGQLSKDKDGNWVFNVLLVASIQDSAYSGQLEGCDRIPKKWVTLVFEVDLNVKTDVIQLGNIYHFCVQENHPRFVLDEHNQIKYFLVPLKGVYGLLDNNVLRLKCNSGTLRGAKEFLERIKQEYLLGARADDREIFEQYNKQWRPVSPVSPLKIKR